MEPPPVAPLPAVLSTQEVAELLRMSTRSVLEMVRAGTLPGRRAPGRRRYHFLAEDVLAAVSHRPVATGADAGAAATPPAAADPCEVWGAAPSREESAWPRRCLERWVELAAAAGLVANPDDAGVVSDPRGVGVVDVDGLAYEVLAGPRQRVRCVGDEGEPAWVLIDSVWVDPRP